MVEESARHSRTGGPERRVVLLGASNVTQGLSTIVDTARHAWGAPLDIVAAIGHGRSYGIETTVLGRRLPSILACRLWDELAARPQLPLAALVTDIGNDIAYGIDVATILGWLEECLHRLVPAAHRLVVTRLPLHSLFSIPPWKYRIMRSLLFPSSRIGQREALERAEELDQQIITFASRFGAYVLAPAPHWYTWDPIHISRAQRAAAWQKLLTSWSDGTPPAPAQRSIRQWLALQRARPAEWKLCGISRQRTQPTTRLSDGSTLSLY